MIRKINFGFWITVIFFISAIFYAGVIEPNRLVVRQETLFLPNWKQQGLKVGIISDIHIGTKFSNIKKLEKTVKAVNSQNPDLIVLLGDFDAKYIEKSKIDKNEISTVLKKLNAKYGVVSILGNHDYNPPFIVKDILHKANITVLENESVLIKSKIKIVGLKDMWHYKFYPNDIIGSTQIPTIVLSHNPDYFPQISSDVSLTLSGHTHGGEIYFPYLGAPFVPSKYNQKYRKGYIVENSKHLYVTSGIASLSGFRLFNPPEVVILTINPQDKNNKNVNTSVKKGFVKNYFKVPNSLK